MVRPQFEIVSYFSLFLPSQVGIVSSLLLASEQSGAQQETGLQDFQYLWKEDFISNMHLPMEFE